MAAHAAHTTNKSTHLLTAQKTTTKQEPFKRAYLLKNEGLGKKKTGKWAKSRKGQDRKSNRTMQKNKRGDNYRKWDQTDSPEIPDRGETSEISGLLSGEVYKRVDSDSEGQKNGPSPLPARDQTQGVQIKIQLSTTEQRPL